MTCLLKKKKKQHTHARQVISNGFTNMCALGTIEEETPELLPFWVKIHPQALPLWGLCLAPPCPGLAGLLACSLGDTPTLGRRSALRSRAGPRAPRLQDSPAAFTVLVGSTGTWPTRLPWRFQEPGLIGFRGGDVGWASTSEKAKHCEKNRACAISN